MTIDVVTRARLAANFLSSPMRKHFLGTVLKPAHIRRTSLLALIVGTWLTAFNQGDALLTGGACNIGLCSKIFLNYLTPFVVANLGLLSRQSERP